MGEFYCREMHSVTFPGTFCAYEYTIMTPTKTIGGNFFFWSFFKYFSKKIQYCRNFRIAKIVRGIDNCLAKLVECSQCWDLALCSLLHHCTSVCMLQWRLLCIDSILKLKTLILKSPKHIWEGQNHQIIFTFELILILMSRLLTQRTMFQKSKRMSMCLRNQN